MQGEGGARLPLLRALRQDLQGGHPAPRLWAGLHPGHEQALSPLEDRRGAAAAAERAGLCAEGSPIALHRCAGARASRPERDRGQLREHAGPAGVPSGADDGAAAQRLRQRHRFVAAPCQGVQGARRLHDDRGRGSAGLPHHLRFPQAAPAGAEGAVRAGSQAVRGGRADAARACGVRRLEDQGQRLQAQGDVVRADGGAGERAGSGGRPVAGRGRGGRCGGGQALRPGQARRRAARLGGRQEAAGGQDPGRAGRAGGGGQGGCGGGDAAPGRSGGEAHRGRPQEERLCPEAAERCSRTARRSATSPIRRAGS